MCTAWMTAASLDLLYGALAEGSRARDRPKLRFKDICKRDLKSAGIDVQCSESVADSRAPGRAAVKQGVRQAEEDCNKIAKKKRASRKSNSTDQSSSTHVCSACNRDCHSRIDLHSHTRGSAASPTSDVLRVQPSSPETEGGRRRHLNFHTSYRKRVITSLLQAFRSAAV